MYPFMIFVQNSYMFVLISGIVFMPGGTMYPYLLTFLFKMRSVLGGLLIPIIVALKVLEKSHALKIPTAPVPVM